jgi:hypothetical protein
LRKSRALALALPARQRKSLAQITVVRLATAGHPAREIARTRNHVVTSDYNDDTSIGVSLQKHNAALAEYPGRAALAYALGNRSEIPSIN